MYVVWWNHRRESDAAPETLFVGAYSSLDNVQLGIYEYLSFYKQNKYEYIVSQLVKLEQELSADLNNEELIQQSREYDEMIKQMNEETFDYYGQNRTDEDIQNEFTILECDIDSTASYKLITLSTDDIPLEE